MSSKCSFTKTPYCVSSPGLCVALAISYLITLCTANHHHYLSSRDEKEAEMALGKPFLEYLLARAQMHVASPVTSSRHPISDYNHVNEQDGISEESDSIDTNNGNMPSFMANFPTAQKREIRRCGKHLIKHLLSVCNNCLRSPHTDFIGMSEKRAISSSMGFLSAAKRDTSGAVTKVTKMCCLQACSDDEVKQFCCVP